MSKKNLFVLENLKKQIEDLSSQGEAIRNQKSKLIEQLKKECTHPKQYLRFKIGWFSSGEDASIGYTEPSMPERWCALCGFRENGRVPKNILDKWDHSWIPDSLAIYKVLKGEAKLGEEDNFSEMRERTGKKFLASTR